MKQLISLLYVITSITGLYSKDTYEKVFETIEIFAVDLNQDGYPDSLVLEKLFYIDSETGEKTDDPGDFHRITFILNNKRIVKFNKGGWAKNERRKEEGDSIFNIHTNLFFTLRLPENRIGLVFTSCPYASDPEKHTIYTVSEDAEIETVYDAYFNITEFKDVNSDGIKEIIGPIGYYGDINPDKTFVPFKIYTIKDTIKIDENLSYAYNHQLKKYRDFPEVSIKKMREEELKKYDKKTLRIMRNEVYADYGYIFRSDDLRRHFEQKSWYKSMISSAEKITNTYLTDYERYNIELIKRLEQE